MLKFNAYLNDFDIIDIDQIDDKSIYIDLGVKNLNFDLSDTEIYDVSFRARIKVGVDLDILNDADEAELFEFEILSIELTKFFVDDVYLGREVVDGQTLNFLKEKVLDDLSDQAHNVLTIYVKNIH